MSLCDTDKNQVESTDEYPDLKKKMDLMGLLNLIKKLVYTGGTNDLNTRHNKGYGAYQPYEPTPGQVPEYTRVYRPVPSNEESLRYSTTTYGKV